MEAAKNMSIANLLVPFSIVLFIIAIGVILLYHSFQKKLYINELENAANKARHQEDLLENAVMVQETERKRIASDLHDELGAIISIMKMNLLFIMQKEKKGKEEPDPATLETLQNLTRLAETGLNTVRNLSHQLMPPQLAAFGLIRTLNSFADSINGAGLTKIVIDVPDELPEIEWMTTLGLYRILMELLTNTLKHAQASLVTIDISISNKNELLISYADNGIGLPTVGNLKAGMGLKNIEARVNVLKGTYNISSPPGARGFQSAITIPL
ncbi:sensor histidine kinase [Chitinophaga sancti]|uniref:histidine kinase n=1 Tax=Chitinophaga sancti TaxID=1004 RepID=A0A1K1R4E8_9BACT|nr:histidine kinase [Chitinophaga sancti]WQD64289.1 histidine kinase [Chitinophaga sancti]WQG90087.1 histidine kinase [Chitinophaga sancti]SFW66731.1 Signal transduction histidine kinase [Chitinophaga sancti]